MSPDSKPLLLEVMEQACFAQENWRLEIAAEIEALRDWLLPEEPEFDVQPGTAGECIRWHERQLLRAALTEQAQLAREC